MPKKNNNRVLAFTIIIMTLLSCNCVEIDCGVTKSVGVGVILDMSSSVGDMAKDYINWAISDFYSKYPNYQTRLALTLKDSMNDDVIATSKALELMKSERVHAIIGPQKSSQAKFMIKLAAKKNIPIISFSATSPSISPTYNPFFFRANQDDSAQVQAIASLIQNHGWNEVVVVYEDTEYGNGLLPYLTDAFREINIRISYRSSIPAFSSGNHRSRIAMELSRIMARETRVVLVHMTALLGSELFRLASEAGMMSEGFAWIVTDGLSNLMDPIVSNVYGSMQGVLGVRPYVPLFSKGRKARWEKRSIMNNGSSTTKLQCSKRNLFGLWAYDTVWALAKAVELVSRNNSLAFRSKVVKNASEEALVGLKMDMESGLMLLKSLESTKFEGLSGHFDFAGRKLQAVRHEITNIVGKRERVIGYWSEKKGLTPKSSNKALENSSIASMEMVQVKPIIWPGSAKFTPKGWVIPITGKKLKIGVPITTGKRFIRVDWDPLTNEPLISGFTYDIFQAVLEKLPFAVPCKFIPHGNGSKMTGTYNDLVYEVKTKTYDAVIGDITILANRTRYVDFTLPYLDAGVSMMVKTKENEKKNMWIFLKPLSWDLWLTIVCGFVFTGFTVWVFEHPKNSEFGGPLQQQLGTIFWFSFSTLVFAHRERVVNNWSRFVLIIWIFVVLILTQSYTASLASMLTVQRLQPAIVDVDELKRNDNFVGYSNKSFVREFLTEQLNFDKSKLRGYSTQDEYHEALSRGSKNGGVDAIFDEIPYLRPFMAKYCTKYTTVGPIYKSDGFGFAFPIGSPLVSYISRAILNVTEDHKKMGELEQKHFGDQTMCKDQSSQLSSNNPSLSVYSFAGLFIITGLASGSSCLIYLIKLHRKNWSTLNTVRTDGSIWSRVTKMANYFANNDDVPLPDLNNKTELHVGAEVIHIYESKHQNLSTSVHCR